MPALPVGASSYFVLFSLVCVRLVVVAVFIDVGLLVGLSSVGGCFAAVVVVVGHVCVAVVSVLFVVRPSVFCSSVVWCRVHFVHEAAGFAGSFLCTEHKINSLCISEAWYVGMTNL